MLLDQSVVCPVLIGRDAPLTTVVHTLDRARDGNGGTLLVSGEAGVGKSRLVRAMIERARAAGFVDAPGRVLRGRSRPAVRADSRSDPSAFDDRLAGARRALLRAGGDRARDALPRAAPDLPRRDAAPRLRPGGRPAPALPLARRGRARARPRAAAPDRDRRCALERRRDARSRSASRPIDRNAARSCWHSRFGATRSGRGSPGSSPTSIAHAARRRSRCGRSTCRKSRRC